MKKTVINVPKGIRYLSEWEGFSLPDEVCIINKQITGCGFTEFCLSLNNPQEVILVSPRKILLENKEEQHRGEVYYATSELDRIIDYEKDLSGHTLTKVAKECFKRDTMSDEQKKEAIDRFKLGIRGYSDFCYTSHKPAKILVTYDSFRYVKEALGNTIKEYHIVVDEFQSILVDAKFKSSTEIEFLNYLQGINNISFVSATPLLDKYLGLLDEFKDLHYYEFDWGALEPSRITRPELKIKEYDKGIYEHVADIIGRYKEGKFESSFREINGIVEEIQSKEAVLYINSVKALCSIIKKNCLTLENTNVLCARNSNNEELVRSAFNESYKKLYPDDKSKLLPKKGASSVIGKVPTKGQPHKMFTLCTRTVYLGADFYSTNARTFIFSDANVDSLTVDVSMDLEQILGRQRLDINPWKNSATLYIKLQTSHKTQEEFNEELEKKRQKTINLLSAYNEVSEQNKHDLAETLQRDAKNSNYKYNYVAVNTHLGQDLVPVFNNLMLVAEQRAFEIQQTDYKDRFTVFNALGGNTKYDYERTKFDPLISTFESINTFIGKMRFVESESILMTEEEFTGFLKQLPNEVMNFVTVLGWDEIKACNYQRSKMINRLSKKSSTKDALENIKWEILKFFIVGKRYTKSFIKETIKNIYESNNYGKTPKAIDLGEYFDLKNCLIPNKETGKSDNGYEILKQKDQ